MLQRCQEKEGDQAESKELFLKDIFHSILSQMFSSLYHISGEVVKDELDEMPKESQAQNGLENSEKGRKKLRIMELKSSLKRHGEEGAWRAVPDQPGHKDWSTVVHGEIGKFKAKAFE